jgi:Zn-dependent peptidase ImmA (M78 family)
MTMLYAPYDRQHIRETAHQALITAHLDPANSIEPVAPLREIIKFHDLQVDELPDLTRRSAETFLREVCGMQIHSGPEQDAELAGFLYANTSGGWILVDCGRQSPLPRRRFSIAHELGHYLLHFLSLLSESGARVESEEAAAEFREGLVLTADENERSEGVATPSSFLEPVSLSASDLETMEIEADIFAAEILMVESTVCRLASEYSKLCGWSRDVLARRLAAECLVSQTAMRRRLAELGLP